MVLNEKEFDMTNIVSGTTPVALVQNGTVISTVVSDYVNRYRTFARKTAEAIIELSVTLIEAKSELSDEEFVIFCETVGLKKGDSTFKKMMKIGEHATRFRPFLSSLPNSWTTLYKLTCLPFDKFDYLAHSGILTPFITAKEIETEIGNDEYLVQRNTPDLTIIVEDLDPQQKANLHKALIEMAKDYKFRLKATSRLKNEIAQYELTTAA
jgi:hypothetical protein